MRINIVVISIYFMFTILGHADSKLERLIHTNGLVRTIQNYCHDYNAEEFNTYKTISEIRDSSVKKVKEQAYIKSLATADELNILFREIAINILFRDNLTIEDKYNILSSFGSLYAKFLTETDVGIVNLELANTISQFISAMYFSINYKATNIEAETALNYLDTIYYLKPDKYHSILNSCMELNSIISLNDTTNTYQQIMKIINYEDCLFQEHEATFIETIMKKASKENGESSRKFTQFNRYRFAWNTINSFHYQTLYNISGYWQDIKLIPEKTASDKFKELNDKIDNEFSYNEKEFLYVYYDCKTNKMQNTLRVLSELNTLRSNRGNLMLRKYLKSTTNE